MKIRYLSVKNFRNLNSIEISFDEDCNFIVGENNLGKSNLLNLLNTIFNRRAFRIEDFRDYELPIEIKLQIKLADDELGHFEDLFDLEDYNRINISCRQITPEENIEFFHTESETYISPSLIRCVNFIYYDSLRNPISEVNFDKGRGVGRFLTNIVKGFFHHNRLTRDKIVDDSELEDLLLDVNAKLLKIKAFKDYRINAQIDNDIESLIPKLISLQDDKGELLTKSGYGVQFLLLVTLSILEKLQNLCDQRKERGIFENEESGKKGISLILGLDEPEIHLHPYMQRSLIKYLNRVINNENSDFSLLIKELFDIDKFFGQLIIVTHSPSIILNDFRQIIRLCRKNGETEVISGTKLALGEQLEKHLFLHFPFIKEAFFSKCAIFVEGDSEFGSFPFFAEKCGIDFDDHGISVIQAGGDSVLQLIQLGEKFGIPCVGIKDSDGDNSPTVMHNLLKTDKHDFEAELMFLLDIGRESVLKSILVEYDSLGEERVLDAKAINKRAHKKYGYLVEPISSSLKLSEIDKEKVDLLKSYYSTWFSINKSQPLGRLIGLRLKEDEIPQVYKSLIINAQDLC